MPGDTSQVHANRRRDVSEPAGFLVVTVDLGRHRGIGQADEQVGIAVGVEVAPRGSAGFWVSASGDLGGDVAERAVVVAVEPVGAAAEGNEVIEIAVTVGVGQRVGPRRSAANSCGRGSARTPAA